MWWEIIFSIIMFKLLGVTPLVLGWCDTLADKSQLHFTWVAPWQWLWQQHRHQYHNYHHHHHDHHDGDTIIIIIINIHNHHHGIHVMLARLGHNDLCKPRDMLLRHCFLCRHRHRHRHRPSSSFGTGPAQSTVSGQRSVVWPLPHIIIISIILIIIVIIIKKLRHQWLFIILVSS